MSQAWVKRTSGNSVDALIFERFGKTMDEYNAELEREYEIPGLEKVADELYEAFKAGKHIESANDYDADGIMSYANMEIIKEIFESCVGTVDMNLKVPKRFSEGFGIREDYTSTLHDCVLITADNGIAALDAVKKAKENGCTVLITDHHEAVLDENGDMILPEADVIVDPHVTGGEFTDYCGAGIVYKLAKICMEKYGGKMPEWKRDQLMNYAKVNAAVATISDSVPMVGENRKIVKEGLELYSKGLCSFGLKMLANGFGLTTIDEGNIAFSIGPALNAYGRLEDDGSQKMAEAMAYTGRYDEKVAGTIQVSRTMNDIRKKQVDEAQKAMPDIIEGTGQEDSGFLVAIVDCNVGISGIVAARMVEDYKRPSIALVDVGGGVLKGSGRSVDGIHIKNFIHENIEPKDLIHKNPTSGEYEYGGHAGACGITIDVDKFDDFVEAIHEALPLELLPDVPDVGYDLVMKSPALLGKAYDVIRKAGPFGEGNPTPVLLVKDAELDWGSFKVMGKDGNYCKATIKGTPYEVFASKDAAKFLMNEKPEKVDIVCTISQNIFRGNKTIQLSPIVIDHAGRDHSIKQEEVIAR